MDNLEVAQIAISNNLWDPQQICKDIYRETSQRSKSLGRKEDNTTIIVVTFGKQEN